MVDFYELDTSPTEDWGTDGYFIAKRRLMCAWDDRYTLVQEAASGSVQLYPYNKPLLAYSVGATVMPFSDEPEQGEAVDQIRYGSAIVTVTYAVQPYYPQPINNFWVVEELYPYTEYITLPASGLHVGSAGGAAPTDDQRVMSGGMEYTLSIFGLYVANLTGLNMLYTCNSGLWATYLLNWYFNPKKMLMTSASTRAEVRLALGRRVQMHYRFLVRAEDWDKRLTENGWQVIYNDAGSPIVPTADHNLIRP